MVQVIFVVSIIIIFSKNILKLLGMIFRFLFTTSTKNWRDLSEWQLVARFYMVILTYIAFATIIVYFTCIK